MYVDKYSIQDIGTKYTDKGKEKHNQILTGMQSEEGITLRNLSRMIADFEDNCVEYGECEVIVKFTRRDSQ
jgi:hypothetical protein|tara:strand:+ start:1093 stop:1305 length:213 start_codon:yes stop_codon:yes gene_type:complete